MTENEAISRIKYRIKTTTDIIGKGIDGKAFEDMEMAIKALEEIQQYQSIGTVEECKMAKERLIPKKAIIGKVFNTMGYYQCSVCGEPLMRDEKFCNDCGQRIG